MVSRKKAHAELRTLGLFTGKTVLEEAEDALREEEAEQKTGDPTAMVEAAESAAIRWLGMDAFHEGDDVKVAVHPAGHAVLILVRTAPKGAPYSTVTLKLSRAQWAKLKGLARDDPLS